jgi:large subunit ribosomal protein L7/L12
MLSQRGLLLAARRSCRPRTAAAAASAIHSSTPVLQPTPKVNKNDDKIEALFQKILWLDMFEVHMLTELLNEKMGLGDLNKLMSMSSPGSSASAASGETSKEQAAVEEKTLFDLKLVGYDAKAKIKVIKEVRAIAGLGLKEAKELVEGAPKVIKKDIKKEEAEELQKKLEEVGATIEVV